MKPPKFTRCAASIDSANSTVINAILIVILDFMLLGVYENRYLDILLGEVNNSCSNPPSWSSHQKLNFFSTTTCLF